MPNIKSAEKRVNITAKKKLQNQMVRSQMNTAVKKFNAAISAGDLELAKKLMPLASSKIDSAASSKVIHKNAANHKKAQIGRALYQLEQGIIVIKIDAKTAKQAEQKAAAEKRAQEEKTIRETRTATRLAKEAAKAPAAPAKKTTAKTAATAPKKPAEKKEEAPKKETAVKKAPKKAEPKTETKAEVVKPEEDTSDEIK